MKTILATLTFLSLCLGAPSFAGTPRQEQSHSRNESGVVWFDIMTSNLSRASEFYSKLFGWRFSPESRDYYVIGSGLRSIGGLMLMQAPSSGGGVAIYFEVKDIGVKLEQAESLGATVVVSPTSFPSGGGTFALFKDLDGNLIGLLSAGSI